MKKKTQILYIHGGMTFRNQRDYLNYLQTKNISLDKKTKWSDKYLEDQLGKDFTVIKPKMPLPENAKYNDWKIVFERYLDLLSQNFILIGNSLGGIFLAQYLSENKLPRRALSVYLVCAPFDDTLSEEDLVGGFRLKSDLSLLQKNTKNLTLFFSKDDPIVHFSHAEKYRAKLPEAKIIVYKSKNGHFQIPKFPEIVKMIKQDNN